MASVSRSGSPAPSMDSDVRLPMEQALQALPAGMPLPGCGWHIPRPSLSSASSGSSSYRSKATDCLCSHHGRHSTSSQGSGSSTASTQSGSSGALLLTTANLAALRLESLHQPEKLGKPLDTVSVASSTHFTVVNGMTRRTGKPLPKCCCQSHRLTALVLSMSCIIFLGIFGAVFYMEMRARSLQVI